jgi:UDP-N-acetylmuramoyl-L-alanyl-D-glutamate--2,6-diaminopimelate ligase
MTFDELLAQIQNEQETAVRIDSRQVKRGDVFVALRGSRVDGHRYIDQAIARGARYVVCEVGTPASCDVVIEADTTCTELIPVADTALATAHLAQARYRFPASRLTNLAVTGTNGKTTVAHLVQACLKNSGRACGLIGTIAYATGQEQTQAPLTTPDALTLARLQAEMLDAGCTHMITEASSHALSQERLAGIVFQAAAFTNLSGDHLDYHKTEEAYLAAKARLFENLPSASWAVLNAESKHAWRVAERTHARLLWYGIDMPADLQARLIQSDAEGSRYTLHYAGHSVHVDSPLPGRHNISNHLACAGLCLAAGLSLESIATGLHRVPVIPGRLERVPWSGRFSVFVDYAHTDDALSNVLRTLRPICQGRLILVFGCGGDRDRSKRPRMARVAEQWSDWIVVTSDNPRREDPQQILQDILAGFNAPEKVHVESERRSAIRAAITQAQAHDIVLIAGKGHETYQLIGDQRLDFSDRDMALACLQERGRA